MNRFYVFAVVAIAVSLGLSFSGQSGTIREKVVRIEVEDTLPELADELANEPLEMQSVFLGYADDRLLLIKAEAALLKYPQLARRILPMYGSEPEFQEILRDYGETVLIPIDYFLKNRVWSIEAISYASKKYDDMSTTAKRLWSGNAPSVEGEVELPPSRADSMLSEEPAVPTASDPIESTPRGLSAFERGWYAVNFIQQGGPGFFGQFIVDDSGSTHWIQTERLVENIASFFTSGIRTIETKSKTGDDINAGDVGWAAVDALVIFGAAKVARLGKAGAGPKSAVGASRLGAASSRAALVGGRGAKWAQRAKWPIIVGITYAVVAHPLLINDLLAGVAKALSLPVWLVQTAGWTLIILPFLYLGSWIMRLLVRPTIGVLSHSIRC